MTTSSSSSLSVSGALSSPHIGRSLSRVLPYAAQNQLHLPFIPSTGDQMLEIEPDMALFHEVLPEFDLECAESMPTSWSILAPSMMHAVKIADNDYQLINDLVQVGEAIAGRVLKKGYWPTPALHQLLASLDMMSTKKLIPLDIWTLDAMLSAGVQFPYLPQDKKCLVVLPCLFKDRHADRTVCVVLEADKGQAVKITLRWIYDCVFLQYKDTEVFALCIEESYLMPSEK